MTAQAGPRAAVLPLGLLAAAGALALAVQAVFDPFTQHIPLCPVRAATGLLCPGCGAIRAVHALLEGDPALALHSNALLVLLLPIAAAWLAIWTVRRMRGSSRTMLPPSWLVVTLAVIALLFGALRNLPALSVLAPPSLVPGL